MASLESSDYSNQWIESNAVICADYNEIMKQIEDADFLAGFVRAINSSLEIESLYAAAARWLYDHLKFNVIVFEPFVSRSGSKPKAFASICKSSCRSELVELTRIFNGLILDEIEGHESLGLPNSRSGRVFNSCIYMNLPDDMGNIALFWGEDACRNMTDVLLNNICDCFASALKNSLKYEALKELSMRDSLTGLFNRRVLEEMLVIESERRDPIPMSMVLIDLDDFKKVNDTYGHQAGDAVLSGFGDFLRRNCRGADLVARYGGEEFAILLASHSLSDASEFAERLQRNLSGTIFKAIGNKIRVTISIGVSNYTGKGKCDSHELLRHADRALYRAKRNGKDQVCISENRPVSQVIKINRASKFRALPLIVLAA